MGEEVYGGIPAPQEANPAATTHLGVLGWAGSDSSSENTFVSQWDQS